MKEQKPFSQCHKGHWILAQMLLLGCLSKLSVTESMLGFFAVNHNMKAGKKLSSPGARCLSPTQDTRDLPP